MDDFDRRRDTALKILARTGIPKRNYLPPTFPFLWKLGIRVPPPHFLTFGAALLMNGIPLGVCWIGLCMMSIDFERFDPLIAAVGLVVVTVLPGALFASYYDLGKRRFRLPRWLDL